MVSTAKWTLDLILNTTTIMSGFNRSWLSYSVQYIVTGKSYRRRKKLCAKSGLNLLALVSSAYMNKPKPDWTKGHCCGGLVHTDLKGFGAFKNIFLKRNMFFSVLTRHLGFWIPHVQIVHMLALFNWVYRKPADNAIIVRGLPKSCHKYQGRTENLFMKQELTRPRQSVPNSCCEI